VNCKFIQLFEVTSFCFRKKQLEALQTAYEHQGIELAEALTENQELQRQLEGEPEDEWSKLDPHKVSFWFG
jgi:hypothetical protein